MRLDARMDYGPVAPDTETLTCPRRMGASDGFDYVVKVRDGGPKSLFNEYVAARIAVGGAVRGRARHSPS